MTPNRDSGGESGILRYTRGMTTLSNGRAVSLAAVVAFSGVGVARGQLYILPQGPGQDFSKAVGLSADGQVAAGWGYDSHHPIPLVGFRWTAQEGRYEFGSMPGGGRQTQTTALSGDGDSVVGLGQAATNAPLRPFIYRRSAGSAEFLGTVMGLSQSEAHGVSGNGSVVAGNAHDSSFFVGQAWRWTQAGGMQALGFTRPSHFYSDATGISRDGRTIVGYSYDGNITDAFTWTEEHGMTALPCLAGDNAHAYGVNATGTIVVGSSYYGGGRDHAVLWENGTVLDLGVTATMRRSFAKALSDDGSVVVGYAQMLTGSDNACIWTRATGMMLLGDYLTSIGVGVPNDWSFGSAEAISADGRTIAGRGWHGSGSSEAYVITIPAPCSIALLGMFALRHRRAR